MKKTPLLFERIRDCEIEYWKSMIDQSDIINVLEDIDLIRKIEGNVFSTLRDFVTYCTAFVICWLTEGQASFLDGMV